MSGLSTQAAVRVLNSEGNLRSSFALSSRGGEGPTVQTCRTTDGAIAFATSSSGFRTGLSKSDWWVVKATPTGGLPGFSDVRSSSGSSVNDDVTEVPSEPSTAYGPPPVREADPAVIVSTSPHLVLRDLGTETGIDHPNVQVQAAPTTGSIHGTFFNGEAALGGGAFYLQFPGRQPVWLLQLSLQPQLRLPLRSRLRIRDRGQRRQGRDVPL